MTTRVPIAGVVPIGVRVKAKFPVARVNVKLMTVMVPLPVSDVAVHFSPVAAMFRAAFCDAPLAESGPSV